MTRARLSIGTHVQKFAEINTVNESGIGNDTSVRSVPSTSQIEPQPRPDSSTMPEDNDRVHRYVLNSTMERFSHSRESTPVFSRTSTPQPSTSARRNVRASTPSSSASSRCQGVTRSGTPCRLSAGRGQSYCSKHYTQS